jgi:hypothetical protein
MSAHHFRYATIASFAWLCLPGFALGEDHEAGVPLVPAEAAGAWTLVEAGQSPICIVTLGGAKAGDAGFAAKAPAACNSALPGGVAGWSPTADGMALNSADGHVLIAFNRWSNSLFVSHRASGTDLQLRRGTE